ncbi:MAG: peptidase dimerization domain-containing protein [Acetobacteraceae bacterium]
MYAMAQAMQALAKTEVPEKPRTTFAVTVTGGGTSINAIPNEVWMDVDMRSQSAAELARLEAHFQAVVHEAVAAENAARSTRSGSITVAFTLVGDRPAGETALDSDLVQLATAAITAHGFEPSHEFSSTDANIPMSLGVPAIKMGSGGSGGRAHSLEEWIDVEPTASVRGMAAGLTAILAVAAWLRSREP